MGLEGARIVAMRVGHIGATLYARVVLLVRSVVLCGEFEFDAADKQLGVLLLKLRSQCRRVILALPNFLDSAWASARLRVRSRPAAPSSWNFSSHGARAGAPDRAHGGALYSAPWLAFRSLSPLPRSPFSRLLGSRRSG